MSIVACYCIVDPCWLSMCVCICSSSYIYNIYIYIYIYIYVNPQILIYPFPPFPFGNHVYFPCLCIYFCFEYKLICIIFFKILHISDIIWYLSFSAWLTSLTMIISRSIRVAAKGIISFFLWLSCISLYKYTIPLSIHLSMDI